MCGFVARKLRTAAFNFAGMWKNSGRSTKSSASGPTKRPVPQVEFAGWIAFIAERARVEGQGRKDADHVAVEFEKARHGSGEVIERNARTLHHFADCLRGRDHFARLIRCEEGDALAEDFVTGPHRRPPALAPISRFVGFSLLSLFDRKCEAGHRPQHDIRLISKKIENARR